MSSAHKNSLTIRLNESVVFLRTADFTGRRNNGDTTPSMLRGLLVLDIVKPTKISSVEIDFTGRSMTSWPEGIGARRIDVTEQHTIYSASTVFFRAGSTPSARRTASVGPGLMSHRDVNDTEEHHFVTTSLSEDPVHEARANRRISADSSFFQAVPHSHHEDPYVPPTPPYTPNATTPVSADHRPTLSPARSLHREHRVEDNPAQTLEELRQELFSGLEHERRSPHYNAFSHTPINSSASSIRSYFDNSLSRRTSIEDVPEESVVGELHTRSPSRHDSSRHSPPHGSRTPTTPDAVRDESRGRKHSRFGFTAVSHVLLDAVKDRVRSSSPRMRMARDPATSRDRRNGSVDQDGPIVRGRKMEKGKERELSHHHKEKSALEKFGEMLGLESERAKESGVGWKEFKKGTYTYPISIPIPGNCPPTLDCDYGTVTWRLKAQVHRPGAFTSKLSAVREVILISCPSDDVTEENENILVERQWDSQLQYLISISGRSFYIGGVIPIHFTIMPLAKAKVHRVSVILEERVDYYTQMKRIARTDPARRIGLLSLAHTSKDGGAILPLVSEDPEAFRKSPLYALVTPEDDPSEVASSLMGPGPWTFHRDLQLPASCGLVHFTNKNKKSNIGVTHILKVNFRVERGDDLCMDPKTGTRKLFDIVVQTPVHILSCRCNPEWTALPRYTHSLEDLSTLRQTCPCDIKRKAGAMFNSDDSDSRTRFPALERMASRRSSDSASTAGDSPVNPAMMPSLRQPDSLFSRNTQFERLVSGQESEAGEAPPAYNSVAV